jgi:Bacterial conjugation TrbI-like protein
LANAPATIASGIPQLTVPSADPIGEAERVENARLARMAGQLMAGTIIAASLVSGLNSDLPGFAIAQVTENVFDSIAGRYLLVPQDSRLIGKYDNVVAFGQERALVVWQRIIMPDGTSVQIDHLPATDTGGYAGLADDVDLHTWKLLKGVALATVLGIGSELALGSSDSDLVKALQQSIQSTTNRAGQRLVERNLNVQPTITVRPGWPLRVIVQGHRSEALPRVFIELKLAPKEAPNACDWNIFCGEGRLRRHDSNSQRFNQGPRDRQRSQGSRRRARLPHYGGCRRNRSRLAQDQERLGGDLPARQARRPRAPATDLGRVARGD